jgi:hypothetical protein
MNGESNKVKILNLNPIDIYKKKRREKRDVYDILHVNRESGYLSNISGHVR